ncbi:MAG: hypothetical protein R3E08_07950 [Thiotrichaceae bacterium]
MWIPTLLELELTESVLMQDAYAAAEILRELKSIGIQLAIDDFGMKLFIVELFTPLSTR